MILSNSGTDELKQYKVIFFSANPLSNPSNPKIVNSIACLASDDSYPLYSVFQLDPANSHTPSIHLGSGLSLKYLPSISFGLCVFLDCTHPPGNIIK